MCRSFFQSLAKKRATRFDGKWLVREVDFPCQSWKYERNIYGDGGSASGIVKSMQHRHKNKTGTSENV
jgi:hypothetical protein